MSKLFLDKLFEACNDDNQLNVYAVVDSAKIKKLTNELTVVPYEQQRILLKEEDRESLEEVAPYLVLLKKEDEFTQWVANNVYGNCGAIFITTVASIENLAEHLQPFVYVSREVEFEGEMVTQKGYLAYYDPRVFPDWIESLEEHEQESFFSLFENLYCEDAFNSDDYFNYSFQEQLLFSSNSIYRKGVTDE